MNVSNLTRGHKHYPVITVGTDNLNVCGRRVTQLWFLVVH